MIAMYTHSKRTRQCHDTKAAPYYAYNIRSRKDAMLYDFFLNVGFLGIIVYAFLACVLFGVIIYILVPALRLLFSKDRKTARFDILAHLLVLIIPVIVFGFMCSSLAKLVSYYCEYASETYEICTGKLCNVDFVLNPYRGTDYYSVSFDIGDFSFRENNISIDKTEVEKIKSAVGRDVTVCYKNEDRAQFIYRMFIAGGE